VRGPIAAALVAALWGAAGCAIPRWPVNGPVTSDFGIRFDGLLPGVHRGIDIAVPTGTEVRAMAPATVRFAGLQQGYGNVVWLDHGGEVLSVYGHLSELRVSQGQVVRGDQVLGLSGMSGNASAPHLHFEIWRWGVERDPVPLLGGFPAGR
jgi:murein DD-endopeptidase MepM/ murein hydrolase activator NlpD